MRLRWFNTCVVLGVLVPWMWFCITYFLSHRVSLDIRHEHQLRQATRIKVEEIPRNTKFGQVPRDARVAEIPRDAGIKRAGRLAGAEEAPASGVVQPTRSDNASDTFPVPFPATPAELFHTHDVSAESPELLAELHERARRVDSVCRARRATEAWKGKVMGIFKDKASRLEYCFLPKAGCTFWIRVFFFLQYKSAGKRVDSPWDIPRYKVHNSPNSKGHPWESITQDSKDFLRYLGEWKVEWCMYWHSELNRNTRCWYIPRLGHFRKSGFSPLMVVRSSALDETVNRGPVCATLRFLFVRHPFSRLWSAYVDKLYLPDFWLVVGRKAVQFVRGRESSKHSGRCGHDVTFAEFVEYSLGAYEPHWEPIVKRCDPCQFRPSVVGSMKTFARDSLFLLRRLGLEWVLRDSEQTEQELTTLIEYNFSLVGKLHINGTCIDDNVLERRLWRTFQINGYIPRNVSFPHTSGGGSSGVGEGPVMSKEDFMKAVLNAYRASRHMKKELKRQKQDFLQEALESLPPHLMNEIRVKYRQDMDLFGFNDTNY